MDKRDRKEQAFETLLAENLPAPPETVVAGVTPGHPALRRVVCVRRCGGSALRAAIAPETASSWLG